MNIMNEKKNNDDIFDVDVQLDDYFGKAGTPSRIEAEEKALAFYTGKVLEDARKKCNLTQTELGRRIGSISRM
jgi:hypothetical protein